MTCIVAVYNDKGRCISYCGAKCYNAKPYDQLPEANHEVCQCICNGRNHAQGEMHAFKNYQKGIPLRCEDVEAFAKHRGLDPKKLTIIDRLRVPNFRARDLALAKLKPVKPRRGDLFAYGLLDHRKSSEGAQRRRG
jgi:hypothetical protein